MKKIMAAVGVAAILSLAVPGDSVAFRCGGDLVNVGDKSGKVLIKCGPPTSKEVVGKKTKGKAIHTTGEKVKERTKKQTNVKTNVKTKGKTVAQGAYKESSGKVERWFYNCGEHDFIYVLTFSGGVLEKEETEGYGRGTSDCEGRK